MGRKKLSKEIRDLIFQMVAENPTWGAPRIHGELLLLGFDVSQRTISRWMKRASRDPPARPELARVSCESQGSDCGHGLLHRAHDHFGVLYCFFVIRHDRRRILHFNITKHPTSC